MSALRSHDGGSRGGCEFDPENKVLEYLGYKHSQGGSYFPLRHLVVVRPAGQFGGPLEGIASAPSYGT